MKRILLATLLCFSCIGYFSDVVYANDESLFEDIYNEQLEMSKADELVHEIPKDTKDNLNNIGITGVDWSQISSITPDKIFLEILDIAKKNSYKPVTSITIILAIILLSAIFEGVKTSFANRPMSEVLGVVSTLCICGCIVVPIVECIDNLSSVIKNASDFMLLYIPVISGILISSGQVATAGSYNFLMITVGDVVSQIASRFLVPMLNMILAVAVVSSLSSKMNLSGISDIFNKIVKWILEFVMAVFVALLTLQTFVASASDNVGTKGIKFAINSFVPIVGRALSDAYSTVYGCLRLLKSGVGAFAILASSFIFLPPITECLIWLISLNVCASIGDIFSLKQVSGILRSSAKVVSTMLVILICVMTILIISTGIVLVVGGA